MQHEEWIDVKNIKKEKREEKRKIRNQEIQKWKNLRSICPHIITPDQAFIIKKNLNIANIDRKLLSDDWINYQIQGWVFIGVLTPKDPLPSYYNATDYLILSLDNRWHDNALFKKKDTFIK